MKGAGTLRLKEGKEKKIKNISFYGTKKVVKKSGKPKSQCRVQGWSDPLLNPYEQRSEEQAFSFKNGTAEV
ncbi:hypothetical protein CEXT_344781 [Caerostris extrusa]|uniref:Uncharacterized protein n=1 Tax=Caerostris extrusa TaxID=172846 RepID=A0AAV4P0A4_CAEEX|nr:hypothetical protein CEXT_344781 [Caerostris extrusa]